MLARRRPDQGQSVSILTITLSTGTNIKHTNSSCLQPPEMLRKLQFRALQPSSHNTEILAISPNTSRQPIFARQTWAIGARLCTTWTCINMLIAKPQCALNMRRYITLCELQSTFPTYFLPREVLYGHPHGLWVRLVLTGYSSCITLPTITASKKLRQPEMMLSCLRPG